MFALLTPWLLRSRTCQGCISVGMESPRAVFWGSLFPWHHHPMVTGISHSMLLVAQGFEAVPGGTGPSQHSWGLWDPYLGSASLLGAEKGSDASGP